MGKLFLLFCLVCPSFAFPKDVYIWDGEKMPYAAKSSKNVGGGVEERYSEIAFPFMRYFKAENNNGEPTAAVLILGGGGYRQLALQKDAVPAAKLLSKNGLACFVLAYRLPDNRDGALQDARRAMRLIYKNAKALNIDPEKIGVMGFSAGGHLAARLSNEDMDFYEKLDDADDFPKKAAFSVLIYPAYLADKETLELFPEIRASEKSPRAFIMQTQDDKAYEASSVSYMLALRKFGVPVDFHYFHKGGHGYGLRIKGVPASAWTDLLLEWMRFNKFAN